MEQKLILSRDKTDLDYVLFCDKIAFIFIPVSLFSLENILFRFCIDSFISLSYKTIQFIYIASIHNQSIHRALCKKEKQVQD